MRCAWPFYWSQNRRLLTATLLSKLLLFSQSAIAGNVYAHPGPWTNERGEKIALSELTGKRSLFALFYSSCRTICPMTAKGLKAIERALGPRAKELQIVLVTIDPADKSDQLRHFVEMHKLEGWRVLAGSAAATKALAVDLGLGYEEKRGNPDLHQMHSRTLVIVNERGEVRGSLPIFEFDVQQAVTLLGFR